MLQIIGLGLSLLMLILKEYFAYMKTKKDQTTNGKIEIDEFKKIVDAAVEKLRTSYKKENNQIGSVEDQIDQERRRVENQNLTTTQTATFLLDSAPTEKPYSDNHEVAVINHIFNEDKYLSFNQNSESICVMTKDYLSPYIFIKSEFGRKFFLEKVAQYEQIQKAKGIV